MPRPNDEVAALLGEYAELISITGGDAFRARTYSRAARAIRGYAADASQLDAAQLRQIPGVGKSIADKVGEYFATGSYEALQHPSPLWRGPNVIARSALGMDRARAEQESHRPTGQRTRAVRKS